MSKLKILAITACPTGVAHTFMAAEALKTKAEELGHNIKVETRGSVGAENKITKTDIKNADLVIIAADIAVNTDMFKSKPIYKTSTKDALKNSDDVFAKAIKEHENFDFSQAGNTTEDKQESPSKERKGAYKHLMNGVSFMLPFVVAGGLLIALAFAFDIKAYEKADLIFSMFGFEVTVPHILNAIFQIGASNSFAMMVPILSGYIAFSIADRPGLAPGIVGGLLAVSTGSGFLGGIVAGFMAGYFVNFLSKNIKLPSSLISLLPTLFLPVLGVLGVGLAMYYVIGWPVAIIKTSLEGFLANLQGTNAILLGLIMGGMMAADLGGPINKASYVTAIAFLESGILQPMAVVMAAGMTPPIAIFLVTQLYKKEFTSQEIESGKAAGVLGLAFITEGAIPFAARDPFRVLLSCIVGSAITGALVMLFGITLQAPHGGIFAFLAVNKIMLYSLCIAIGSVITSALYIGLLLKKNQA